MLQTKSKLDLSRLNNTNKDTYSIHGFASILGCSDTYVRHMVNGFQGAKLPEGWAARKNPNTGFFEICKIENTPAIQLQTSLPAINTSVNVNMQEQYHILLGYKIAIETVLLPALGVKREV